MSPSLGVLRFSAFLPAVLVAFLAGCATQVAPPGGALASPAAETRSHPFEKHLYVANQSIPYLSREEWVQIQTQWCSDQADCVFESATRESKDLVVVKLVGKGHSLTRPRRRLFFEKKGDRWVENTARAKETVQVIPLFQ
jgi:hypothetical protein